MQGSGAATKKSATIQLRGKTVRKSALDDQDSFIAIFTAVSICVYLLGHYIWQAHHAIIALYAALLLGGVPLVARLLAKLFRRAFDSDLLAGFSIVTAVLLREYLVASIIVLMLSGGTALERYATRRASAVLGTLAKRMPTIAHRLSSHGLIDINIPDISPGVVLVVLPHEICPVDGKVIEGYGSMDESYLTGEPYEISKAPGTNVLSGAVNGATALTIQATRLATNSRFARIMRIVEEAEQNRPPMRRLADRLGAWYTPLALTVALLGWWAGGTPERFLAVVVIATPCPLLIAVPVAILAGISLAAKRGIVVKSPAALEELDNCRTFIFDKTGTLTYGRPVLTDIVCAPGFALVEVLGAAASLEQYSRHPLSQAVLDAAKNQHVSLSHVADVSEHPGAGLKGTVARVQIEITGRKTAITRDPSVDSKLPPVASGLECLVFFDSKFAALFRFHDEPRSDSRDFVQHLQARHGAGRVILLSGDRQPEVEHLAEIVGIREVYFGKSPEDKVAFVQEENARAKTLFVGDGINDAPAMFAATVGIAVGQNSDVTAESAHVVVLDSSLRKVDEVIHVARRIRSIALESALGGMAVSAVGMMAAALGFLPPIAGAMVQEIIDLAAVLNALRAIRPPKQLSDF